MVERADIFENGSIAVRGWRENVSNVLVTVTFVSFVNVPVRSVTYFAYVQSIEDVRLL